MLCTNKCENDEYLDTIDSYKYCKKCIKALDYCIKCQNDKICETCENPKYLKSDGS